MGLYLSPMAPGLSPIVTKLRIRREIFCNVRSGHEKFTVFQAFFFFFAAAFGLLLVSLKSFSFFRSLKDGKRPKGSCTPSSITQDLSGNVISDLV